MNARPRYDAIRLDAPALGCVRGGVEIFSDLDLCVGGGEAVVIRGANGAGKSSALLTLAGHLGAKPGAFQWLGGDPETASDRLIHFIGHLPAVQKGLSVRENLSFWTKVFGAASDRLERALGVAGLATIAELPCETLSAGQTRRLALARLVAAPRPAWLLDEPTAALDKEGTDWVRTLVLDHLEDGGLAVIASHLPLGIETDERVRIVDIGGGAP